ncbi:ankyrin repeat-containing domain protein [Aspergillus filifer]
MILELLDTSRLINTCLGPLKTTPIFHAVFTRRLDNVKLLIENQADTYTQANGMTLIHCLATTEDEEFSIPCLEALGPTSRADLETAVVQDNNQEGTDSNSDTSGDDAISQTPFEIAVENCLFRFADRLLALGANQTASRAGWAYLDSLIRSLIWSSVLALRYYLEKVHCPFILREDISESILHIAVSVIEMNGDNTTGEQKFELILDHFSQPCQVNARILSPGEASDGETPLHRAARFGVLYAARRLLAAGADWGIQDSCGRTPLDLAHHNLAFMHKRLLPSDRFKPLIDLQSTVKLLEQARDPVLPLRQWTWVGKRRSYECSFPGLALRPQRNRLNTIQ